MRPFELLKRRPHFARLRAFVRPRLGGHARETIDGHGLLVRHGHGTNVTTWRPRPLDGPACAGGALDTIGQRRLIDANPRFAQLGEHLVHALAVKRFHNRGRRGREELERILDGRVERAWLIHREG